MNQICRSNRIKETLASLVIICDSREKPTRAFKARTEYFPRWRQEKLDAGDYGCELNVGGELIRLPVAIERKMSLDELCQCFGKERGRFEREFERAKESGTKMYLLVENADWEKIYSGDYRSLMKPKALLESLLAWSVRYGITFLFCEPDTSGRLIYDVLRREAREWLSNAE